MKAHLKKAAEGYITIRDREYLIHPISEIDAEIIVELGEVFRKLGREDLSSIIDNWKYNKDSQVRDELLQWNIDNHILSDEEEVGGVSNVPPPSPTIIINDYHYSLWDIFAFGKIEEWDYQKEAPSYGLLLNEIPEETKHIPLYANKKIFFEFETERNEIYDILDNHFRNERNKEYIN